jgi:hypothetical protein
MSMPQLFIVEKSQGLYQLFYTKETKTDVLHYYKISPAELHTVQSINPIPATSKLLEKTLIRWWDGDTILDAAWRFADLNASILRPDGRVFTALPVLCFENPEKTLPFKKFFQRSYSPISCLLPAHVKLLILNAAIQKGDTCSISFEPITLSSVVTSCGHVFEKESIEKWLTNPLSNRLCPMCKQPCCI